MRQLEGKVAVVTGGTRGIGLAIVKAFLQEGASVALFGSRQETVDKALAEIQAAGKDAKVIGLAPDLANYEAVLTFWRITRAFRRENLSTIIPPRHLIR